MIITIDGPSGTGKTTVAKRVAERLRFAYFDTGAMYRSVAWLVLQRGVDPKRAADVGKLIEEFPFRISPEEGEKRYFVGDTEVTTAIRSRSVNAIVSEVSAHPIVRQKLWAIQRSFADCGHCVFEGRDMGSVVFPQADVKIFLTASAEVRAQRRLDEMLQKNPADGLAFDREKMAAELIRRDQLDSTRPLAPLQCPKGAHIVDTSDLSIDQVVDEIILYVQKPVRATLLYRSIIVLTRLFFRLCYRHKVYGLEHYFRGGAVIAANHTSFLDPPAVAISSPEPIHFLARASLFRHKGFGALIKAINTHPLRTDRADAGVFKLMQQLIASGQKVLIFPEGTRSLGDAFGEMKLGVSLLVWRTGAAILPVYIAGTAQVWGRLQKWPKIRGNTACIFGTPIAFTEFSHLEKREALEAIAARLAGALASLKAWYIAGARGTPP